MQGHEAIVEFLTKKWQKENGYRLRKDLFAWTDNKIAVQVCYIRANHRRRTIRSEAHSPYGPQFFYEWYATQSDGSKQWYRCYGLEVCNALLVHGIPLVANVLDCDLCQQGLDVCV